MNRNRRETPPKRSSNPKITQSEHYAVLLRFFLLVTVGVLLTVIPGYLDYQDGGINLFIQSQETESYRTSTVVLIFSICPMLFDIFLDSAYGFASKKSEQDWMARVGITFVISISTLIMIFEVKTYATLGCLRAMMALNCIHLVFGNAVLFCLYHCDRTVFTLGRICSTGLLINLNTALRIYSIFSSNTIKSAISTAWIVSTAVLLLAYTFISVRWIIRIAQKKYFHPDDYLTFFYLGILFLNIFGPNVIVEYYGIRNGNYENLNFEGLTGVIYMLVFCVILMTIYPGRFDRIQANSLKVIFN